MSYISLWECQEVVPQGPFGQIKLYFGLEKRPAGAFWADKIVFLCLGNGGLKNLWVDLVRKYFDRPTKYTKGNSGGQKVFYQSFG